MGETSFYRTVAILAGLSILLYGVLNLNKKILKTKEEITQKQQQRSNQVWRESELGVKYFVECIEGHLFIVTGAGHGWVTGGPIGKCE